MKSETEKTAIIFRMEKAGKFKQCVAFFPLEPATNDGWNVTCYAHIGQHSSACPHYARNSTRPAMAKESASLKRELRGRGYNIREMKRFPRNAFEVRKAALAQCEKGESK